MNYELCWHPPTSQVFYNSIEEAQRDASDAKIWGYIHFATNFSQSLQSYIESGKYVEDNDLENAQIGVYMDMTGIQSSPLQAIKLCQDDLLSMIFIGIIELLLLTAFPFSFLCCHQIIRYRTLYSTR